MPRSTGTTSRRAASAAIPAKAVVSAVVKPAATKNGVAHEPATAPATPVVPLGTILGSHSRAPRAMWKGVIAFAQLSIPVSLFKATDGRDVSFATLHKKCGTRINTRRFCPSCDATLGDGETTKGYEYSSGSFIEVTEQELESMPVPTRKTIGLAAFVPAADVDPLTFEQFYRVLPEALGQRPYALLLHTLRTRQVVAVARVTLRTRESLCLLRADAEGIALVTLYYQDEVRHFAPVPPVPLADAELKLCDALVEALSEPFDPAAYRDTYRESLLALIEAKVNKQRLATGGAAALAPAPTTDLMTALKASLAQARRNKQAAA